MMDKQLTSRISEYGLPLLMREIAQHYTLAGHIKSSCPYSYTDSGSQVDAQWFLLQHDATGTRDLVLTFESECEIKRAGYSFGRGGSNGRSWGNFFTCRDSCYALSLLDTNAWKEHFELSPYLAQLPPDQTIAFKKIALDQAEHATMLPLFNRSYSGEHIFNFTRDLLQWIPRYKDILSKGRTVETLIWHEDFPLTVTL